MTMRGNTKSMTFLGCILSLIIISFCVYAFYIFKTEPAPTEVRILITILISLFIFIPGIVYLSSSIFSYLKKLCIQGNTLTFIYPLKKKVIHVEELSFWGCVAYAPRSTMLFFCTADQDTVLNYLYTHWPLCERIFGKDSVDQRKCDHDGLIQLAVGTYLYRCLFYPRHDVFILDFGTPKRLKLLVDVLKRDALITGSWLIKTKDSWIEYAKYKAKSE